MSWILVVVLIVVGILLLLLELLVIPGATVAGIAGFGLIAFSVYLSYDTYGATAGHWTLAGAAVGSLLSIIFAFRSRTWKNAGLESSITGKANTFEDNSLQKGDTGITMSRLAPSGKARIKGQYYEVQSIAGMVNAKEEIVVTKVEGNRIYVKPK